MTRGSNSSKHKSSGRKKQSRMSQLRKKLTLNRKSTPAQDDVAADKEKLLPQEEKIEHQEQVFEAQAKKFFQRASPMKLVRLYPNLTADQKLLIQQADYGGLLDIKCSKLHPGLCQFLMESFDPVSCQLIFPGRGAIPVTSESVHKVIGVPMGEIDVIFKRDAIATAYMKEQIGYAGRKQPLITSLEEKLANMRPANSKFLRLFMTYAMCGVLAPTTGVRLSPRVYPSLINIKQAKNLNMAKFVVMVICKALSPDGEKEQVSPCMLYLMVKYLDSLELKDMQVSSEGTRVSVWTNAMVKKAVLQDTKPDGTFGAAPLKPEFAQTEEQSDERTVTDESMNEMADAASQSDIPVAYDSEQRTPVQSASQNSGSFKGDYNYQEPEVSGCAYDSEEYVPTSQSILFSDQTRILKFIETNAPEDRTPEDTARYIEAIEYACHGFESSLQMLVRNLATSTKRNRSNSQRIDDSPPKHHLKKPNTSSNLGEDLADLEKQNAKLGTPPVETKVENLVVLPKEPEVTEATDDAQDNIATTVENLVVLPNVTDVTEASGHSYIQKSTTDIYSSQQVRTNSSDGENVKHHSETEVKPGGKQDSILSKHKVTAALSIDSYEVDGEDSCQSNSSMKRQEFLKFVGSSPVHKIDIPRFELPEFLDMEANVKYHVNEIIRGLKPIDNPTDGLTNLLDGPLPESCVQLLAEMEPKPIHRKRKHVTFAIDEKKKLKLDTQEAQSPSASRYGTISAATNSPRRSPRNHAAPRNSGTQGKTMQSRLSLSTEVINLDSEEQKSSRTTTRTAAAPSAELDPMSRKLDFDSTENERKEKAPYEAPDAPSFDLDTPPDDCDQYQEKKQPGCSKSLADPSGDSITPVPHEYNKRIVKQGRFARSPFVNPETQKSYNVSNSIDTLYSMVCEHAQRSSSKDPNNGKTVIDLDDIFCNLGDLAESVAPRKRMVNIVAEIGIEIIKRENQNPKKVIMPLRISNYLIRGRFELKEVERCFENTPANRLDHKDIICFPTLENFKKVKKDQSDGGKPEKEIGHYFLVNLNIKAQRFEILDSIAHNGEALLMESCHILIGSIKKIWAMHYPMSKIKIIDWPIELIDSPQQDNTFDCGFFLMKNLEGCSNRKPATSAQKDMANIRKLYTDKWLRFNDKVKGWQIYL